jgi:Ca-activated chloride channel family protein
MPETGDQLAPALTEAATLLHGSPSQHAQVILLSDGFVDPAQALQAAQSLRQQGATLHVIGIGTASGAPQPNGQGQFDHDAQGRPLLTRLPIDQLQRVATAGGGDYVPLDRLSELTAELNAERVAPQEQDKLAAQLHINAWRNGGFWLLPPLLLLAALVARRGWL